MSVPFILTHNVEDAHESDVFSLVTCQRHTISCSGDGRIALWDNQKPGEEPVYLNVLNQKPHGVQHLSIDSNGTVLAATYFTGLIEVYDLAELKLRELKCLKKIHGAWKSAIAANGQTLAVVTIDCRLFLLDLEKDEQITEYHFSHDGSVLALSIDLTANGRYIACGLDSGVVQIFSTETGRVDHSLPCLSMKPRCVRFSPNSSLLAVSGDTHEILLFSLNGGDLICSLMGHKSWVFAIAWNSTGQYLLSASQDTNARVWSIEQQNCVATLTDSTKPLFAAAWLDRSWTANVIGGSYEGIVTAGLDAHIRWYRQASGNH